MPRLPSTLLRRAYTVDPLLPLLLRECRDLDSARNELRWLREHAQSRDAANIRGDAWQQRQLRSMVRDRSRGKPLQPETETYTARTARLILSELGARRPSTAPFRILDLCTGTGCIPLLLHSLLAPSIPNLTIVGIDISPKALNLARRNLDYNISREHLLPRAKQDVHFLQANVLHDEETQRLNGVATTVPGLPTVLLDFPPAEANSGAKNADWDVLISNPPYISTADFGDGTTKRSVRLHEPKLALVPPPLTSSGQSQKMAYDEITAREDSFYPRLLDISEQIGSKLSIFECGDLGQARRITAMVDERKRSGSLSRKVKTEIWKCDGFEGNDTVTSGEDIGNQSDDDQGARAVVMYRNTVSR
ncbi:predicted protein [Uncinocarpus reesii 1704]|uniref:Uncharacterized protein n=1 Tax=Uncinocarpus reesii (strain UAMH 1704) TaxID=336963 RepID=C4JP63_UNCRE|nr:uncharacterized protein UREG_03122 [Uncinocarpus reesii 1704]EEP78277.1 predicted protein [Uncinocarpus reesii 1704]